VEKCGRSGQTTDDSENGVCALHARHLKLKTYAQNMQYPLLFHGNNGYANAS